MDELTGFLTSKLAAGVFACGLICTVLTFFRVVERQIETGRLRVDAERVSRAIEWLTLSPWDGCVKMDLSNRMPLDLEIRGEICPDGEFLTISAGRRGVVYEHVAFLPLPVNGGDFEVRASNPRGIAVEKKMPRGLSVALCTG